MMFNFELGKTTYVINVEKECIVDVLRGRGIGNPVKFV